MDTPRETKEITTTGGHTAVLYTYITGREAQDVAKRSEVGEGGEYARQVDANNYAIGFIVRELDGSSENVLDRVLSLPITDFSEIQDMVAEISSPKKK